MNLSSIGAMSATSAAARVAPASPQREAGEARENDGDADDQGGSPVLQPTTSANGAPLGQILNLAA